MPTTPYAGLLISVNGDTPTRGARTVAAGDTIAFSFESTVGWPGNPLARIEFYSYPEGWTGPGGAWTEEEVSVEGPNGSTITYTAFVHESNSPPASFTMPSDWGKYLPRLIVNDGNKGGGQHEDMIDTTPGLEILSSQGLHDLAWQEGSQFSTEIWRKWQGDQADNLRTIETKLAAAAGAVTSVTGTPPIVSSGGATPAISISAASGGAAGSMSAAHYTLVNNATASPTADTLAKRGSSGEVKGVWVENGSGTKATTGTLRSSSGENAVVFRNDANTADITAVSNAGDDKITIGERSDGEGVVLIAPSGKAIDSKIDSTVRLSVTASGAAVTGVSSATAGHTDGSGTKAGSGTVRASSTETIVAARNAGDTADITALSIAGDDKVVLGETTDGAGVVIKAPTTKAITMTVGAESYTCDESALNIPSGNVLSINGVTVVSGASGTPTLGNTASANTYVNVASGGTISFQVNSSERAAVNNDGLLLPTDKALTIGGDVVCTAPSNVPTFGSNTAAGVDIRCGAAQIRILVNNVVTLELDPAGIGFLGAGPVGAQTVTGSRGGNAALASLLTALATFGLIIDSTSA